MDIDKIQFDCTKVSPAPLRGFKQTRWIRLSGYYKYTWHFFDDIQESYTGSVH